METTKMPLEFLVNATIAAKEEFFKEAEESSAINRLATYTVFLHKKMYN